MAYPISQSWDAPSGSLTNVQIGLPAKGHLKVVTVTHFTGYPATIADQSAPVFVVIQVRTSTAWFLLKAGWVRDSGAGSTNIDGLTWEGSIPLDLVLPGANTLWIFTQNDTGTSRAMSVAGFVE